MLYVLLYLCYMMFGFIGIVLICFLSISESGMFWNIVNILQKIAIDG